MAYILWAVLVTLGVVVLIRGAARQERAEKEERMRRALKVAAEGGVVDGPKRDQRFQ